jgi:hypothetical protein
MEINLKMYEISGTGVQGKNNAYHNANKVQNSLIDALFLPCTPE